jgi:hypothetical protein
LKLITAAVVAERVPLAELAQELAGEMVLLHQLPELHLVMVVVGAVMVVALAVMGAVDQAVIRAYILFLVPMVVAAVVEVMKRQAVCHPQVDPA